MSCWKTTFSKILEIKGSFEMGLSFFKSLESREDFFRRGCRVAFLKVEGTTPVASELFTIARIKGQIMAKISLKS